MRNESHFESHPADPEALSKFDYQFLDAIRDVEAELFSGSNPLMKSMLQQVLDRGTSEEDLSKRQTEFRSLSTTVRDHLINRLDFDTLVSLVQETGAEDGGSPELSGRISENDLLAALKLFVKRLGFSLPAVHNGLGYNNLIYISLVLSSLDFKVSVEKKGQNAVAFPILLIEEPEAHLHPALQYKLLTYIRKRSKRGSLSRQVFISTHSTHITSASGLEPIICLCAPDESNEVSVSYPSRVFSEDAEGRRSRKYVERYLDATKSNMLFSKSVIFVEGIAEQLLVPRFAEYLGTPLEEHHVAIIPVGGLTFKHFLPIFGASPLKASQVFGLKRRIACIVDADPMREEKGQDSTPTKCWPYQINFIDDSVPSNSFTYHPVSSVVNQLDALCQYAPHVAVYYGIKTLEYDLAEANCNSSLLITSACRHKEKLLSFIDNPANEDPLLKKLLLKQGQDTINALEAISNPFERKKAQFATYYLLCTESEKGEHAFDLVEQLRQNLEEEDSDKLPFEVPRYIKKAIEWVCGSKSAKAMD